MQLLMRLHNRRRLPASLFLSYAPKTPQVKDESKIPILLQKSLKILSRKKPNFQQKNKKFRRNIKFLSDKTNFQQKDKKMLPLLEIERIQQALFIGDRVNRVREYDNARVRGRCQGFQNEGREHEFIYILGFCRIRFYFQIGFLIFYSEEFFSETIYKKYLASRFFLKLTLHFNILFSHYRNLPNST